MANILVVDDSATLRRLLTSLLEAADHTVSQASDGEHAFPVMEALAPFDVIISDIIMPTMDGITFIKKVRDHAAYAHIPILVLTTEYSNEKRREGDVAGANGWAVKPFSPAQLLSTIEALLKMDISLRR